MNKLIYTIIGLVIGGALMVGSGAGASFIETIQGWVAENAAVGGNPVLTGGRYDSSPRTLDDGDAGAFALDADGALHIADGGNTITVDGNIGITGTSTLATEDTLAIISGDTTSLDGKDLALGTDISDVFGTGSLINGSNLRVEIFATSTLATEDTLASALTALQIIDDWDDSNYANVNLNYAGTDAATGGGVESGSLRVTIANDSTGLVSVDDNGGNLSIDDGGNVISVDDAAGSLTIDDGGVDLNVEVTETSFDATQSTHDNLNLNANLQIANSDNSLANPGFFEIVGTSTLATEDTLAIISGDTTSLDGKDLALGTDISNVFGVASLILATQADNVANTSDGLQASTFNYLFDGSTWDRWYGDSTNGGFVNLKASALDLMLGTDFSAVLGTSDITNGTNSIDSIQVINAQRATSTAALLDFTRIDDSPTEATSNTINSSGYYGCNVYISHQSDGAPTTVKYEFYGSEDGTNFFEIPNGVWAANYFEDTSISSTSSIAFACPQPVPSYFQVKAVGAGTDATNYFDVEMTYGLYR